MTDPIPLPPEERFKDYEDPHFHDDDEHEGGVAHGDAPKKKIARPKPRAVPNPRRRFQED
jgi:hypothetical protein